MRIRKQNEVEAKNNFYFKLLHEALPPENVSFKVERVQTSLIPLRICYDIIFSILTHGLIHILSYLVTISRRRIQKVIQLQKNQKRSQHYFKKSKNSYQMLRVLCDQPRRLFR